MYVINVYKRYYKADCLFAGVQRNAALIELLATYDDGQLKYDAVVNFFPFEAPDDFAISYDAVLEKTLFDQRGRRSARREKVFLEKLQDECDELAQSVGGRIFWDRPLTEAILG